MGDPIKKITLKDGTVRYFVIDISRDPKTGKRRQLTKTYDTKKEARAEYAKIKHQTDEGTFVAPDKLTVSDWLDTWLKSATIDVEKATAANYADALLPVRERLGDRRLQQLDEEDIDNLVSWMLTSGRKRGGKVGTGLSARSVQLTLGRLRSALNVAVRRKWSPATSPNTRRSRGKHGGRPPKRRPSSPRHASTASKRRCCCPCWE